MGGFVAAVPRGAPASPELIERVLAASRDRAPDGVRHVVTPEGTLLVQCLFANTPESVGEVLPKCDPSGRVWIVKRGHLNNIEELRGQLRDRLGPDARVHSDADVMLAAYLAWGPDMAGRIHGEFTLAIWDGRNRSLFVLRDHLGLRGCYVHDGDQWYVAASEPAQVLVFPGVSDELDEMGVVDYLSASMIDRVRTFWAGVRRPMPATSIVARDGDACQRMYWMPTLCADKATKGPEYYSPALFSAFEAAVRSAMRTSSPVACDLSGGLDSSAIVGMCAHLKATSAQLTPDIMVQSMLYHGLDCDESEFIAAVLEKWPLPSMHFDALATVGPSEDPVEWIRSLRTPFAHTSSAGAQRVRWLQEQGFRVLLSGDGGDEIFRVSPLPLDRGLRPRGEIWPYFWWSSRCSLRTMAMRIRTELVRPLVPAPLLALYLRLVDAVPTADRCMTEYAHKLYQELTASQPRFGTTTEFAIEELWNCGGLFGAGGADATTMRLGYEIRRPLLDMRLINQLARIPLLVHRWNGVWRSLQKTTFANLYPDVVASRTSKADFTHASILNDKSTVLDDSDLFEYGLIDRTACEGELSRATDLTAAGGTPSWSAIAIRELARWRAIDAASHAVARA